MSVHRHVKALKLLQEVSDQYALSIYYSNIILMYVTRYNLCEGITVASKIDRV